MKLLTELTIGLVALVHGLFLILEMYLWRTQLGQSNSGLSVEMAAKTTTLAASQKLCNGFLASGLVWSLYVTEFSIELREFFVGCVVEAGACLARLPSAVSFFRSCLTRYFRTGAVWLTHLLRPHDLSL